MATETQSHRDFLLEEKTTRCLCASVARELRELRELRDSVADELRVPVA
jgi:hypothetical protein